MIISCLLNMALTAATLLTPAPDATEVSPATPIVVQFSEAMPHTTGLTIEPAVACYLAWSADDRELTCQHTAPLASAMTYTVSAGAMRMTFTTGSSIAPAISGSTPPSGSLLSRTGAVVITFDRPMDPVSTAAAVSFPADMTMHGDFAWANDNTELTFTPAVPWAQFYHDTWTMLVIDPGATSGDGVMLAAPLILTFSLPSVGVVTYPLTCAATLTTGALTTLVDVDLTSFDFEVVVGTKDFPPTALTVHVAVTNPQEGLMLAGHAPIHRVKTSDPAVEQLVYDLTQELNDDNDYQGTFSLGYAATPAGTTQIGNCLAGISYRKP